MRFSTSIIKLLGPGAGVLRSAHDDLAVCGRGHVALLEAEVFASHRPVRARA
jgi:hypothetical protein